VSNLNPTGEYPDTAVCETLGHQWKILFVEDRKFRDCLRCNRQEREIKKDIWEVNKIEPSTA
jgi:hypothetical protein